MKRFIWTAARSITRISYSLRGWFLLALSSVTLAFPTSSLAYWDAQAARWVIENEQVRLQVGASSADIRLNRVIRVTP